MKETQKTITDWADKTFGRVTDAREAIRRPIEEMEEFIRLGEAMRGCDIHTNTDITYLLDEAADVVITLYRLASRLHADLHAEIDRKMAINRARKWRRDGTGHGYHIKENQE